MKKAWIVVAASVLAITNSFANVLNVTEFDVPHCGFFIGLGSSYNSINLTQDSWGKGISNIQTSTGANSNGIAQGTGAPFHNITNVLTPEIQVGYFRYMMGLPNLYGLKFSYQYINAISTNPNLYIPQLGQSTSATGVTTSLFGYVNADSVQVKTKHEMSLLAFIGQFFGNKYIYIGIGPSLFNLRSKNYYSIGYADYEGVTLNVTGLVSYSSPSVWILGGAAQVGMTYFITPTWFIDGSYTYAMTGSRRTFHSQTFANSSSIGGVTYNTSGSLYTKDTLRIKNQTISITINKIFNL